MGCPHAAQACIASRLLAASKPPGQYSPSLPALAEVGTSLRRGKDASLSWPTSPGMKRDGAVFWRDCNLGIGLVRDPKLTIYLAALPGS